MATINSSRKITPCFWFDEQAKDAATFYTEIFGNSSVGTLANQEIGVPVSELPVRADNNDTP